MKKFPRVKGLKDAAAVCAAKKAKDIVILDMRKLCNFTDYFVIASADSSIQARAIADGIEEMFKAKGLNLYRAEGRPEGRWIVLDAGHFIVHIFLKDAREFYNLELLWGDAPALSIDSKSQAVNN